MNKEPLDHHLEEHFKYLHKHPEISWEEKNTTNYLRDALKQIGLEPITFANMTGLYVDIGKGEPNVGLRVDIDALWQEIDGEFQANHSCGHDGHMTVGLGVAQQLYNQEKNLTGAIRIIFQPAEETGQGAKAIIEAGIVENLHYLFGLHVRPLVELPKGVHAASIVHGAGRMIKGEIFGLEAHGARPEQGINAIEVASTLVDQLKRIWIEPNESASIKMTQLEAGGISANIIPGNATFRIDMRAQKNEVMDRLVTEFNKVVESVELLYDAKIDIEITSKIVAANVSEQARNILKNEIVAYAGKENCVENLVTPGGEDFHFYAYERPHLQTTMLGLGCGVTPGLHHPEMTYDQSYLQSGVQIMTNTLIKALEEVD